MEPRSPGKWAGSPGFSRRRLCWAFVVLLTPAAAIGADFANPRFERISIDQGLSQNSVHAMLQDRQGFLWIGTDDGLNRYDGYRFETFRTDHTNPASLSGNRIRSLFEDRDGALWIGTRGGGLSRYDGSNRSFTNYRHDAGDADSLAIDLVWAIHQDRRGTMWIGTGGAGLDRFEPDRPGSFTHLRHEPGNPASLTHDFVRTIHEDPSGDLWIGTTRGLNRLDPETGELDGWIPFPDRGATSYNSIGVIHQDSAGRMWIGTWDGLLRFDPTADPPFVVPAGSTGPHHPLTTSVRDIHNLDDGTLWLATDGTGILHFDPETEELLARFDHDPQRPASLSGSRVKTFLADRSGAFWIGTSGQGLIKALGATKAFIHHRGPPASTVGLADAMVTSIYVDRAGLVWVGTRAGGLHALDLPPGASSGRPVRRLQADPDAAGGLSRNDIRAILEDSRGALWIGTEAGGLYRLDGDRLTHYGTESTDPTALRDRDAWVLFEDRSESLWIGTYGGGLSRYDREIDGFRHFFHDPDDPGSLSADVVRAIHQDRHGRLWVGTGHGGLNVFDPTRTAGDERAVFSRHRWSPDDPDSLSSDDVLAIHEDRHGTLWVGTHGGGLNQMTEDPEAGESGISFRAYTEADGLASNVVYGILEDADGRLWLSTNRGLSRLDPTTETFRNYDVSDGLQDLEFNAGAFFENAAGEMFFGGINGFNSFFPERIVDNPYVPPVVLTSFKIFNRETSLTTDPSLLTSVRLAPSESVFSFEFAALSYTAQHKNLYTYRLVGFRDEWTELGAKRDVTFTNLDPGTYTLEVRASNNDGIWNDSGLTLTVIVEPPFWRTWWFLTLSAAALVGFLAAIYQLRTRTIRRHNRELEIEVAERQRAERELAANNAELEERNAEMERFTYTVSHDLKTPLITIKGFLGRLRNDFDLGDDESVESDIDRIASATKTMHLLLDDLLELSTIGRLANPAERVALSEVAAESTRLLADRVDARKVELDVDPDMPWVQVDRLRLGEVYQNLLENAFKFLGEQTEPRIEIGADRRGGEVLCWVRDNGVGIEAPYQEKVFELFQRLDPEIAGTGVGLALVRRIVEVHGGRAWIESDGAGRGCAFFFTLPPAES